MDKPVKDHLLGLSTILLVVITGVVSYRLGQKLAR